jgi:hypothetical protein
MLNTVIATGFKRRMGSGRNEPCLLECEDETGKIIEVVVKYSAALMEWQKNLSAEAIVAMLAADLGLPVPEPFVVELSPAFIGTVTDVAIADALRKSCSYAFGSALRTGMSVWPTHQKVEASQSQSAAEIAVFDQIIVNSDRRPVNPNLLFRGDDFIIFDHELSLSSDQVLFWKEPWVDGGLSDLESREKHIFARPYFERGIADLDRFALAWESLAEDRFGEYLAALPSSWVYDEAKIRAKLAYLMDVRRNIRTITANALRVFS